MHAADLIAVTIAVPTYRRPSDLVELVPMLIEQASDLVRVEPDRYTVRVLIVDNDPDGSGEPACAGFPDSILDYVIEPQAGIAAARNRAVEESSASRLLVMLDDDERPHHGWLRHLVQTWENGQPALVAGRVVADFEGPLDPWLEAGKFFHRRNLTTGDPIEVAAAGNLLLDLEQVLRMGLRFDPRLGLRGGEDTLFSRQLYARGGRMVWCAESAITDRVPLSRMTRRWVLTRAWSHGNTAALIELELASGPLARVKVRLMRLLGGCARMIGGLGRAGFGLATGSLRHQARGMRTALRGAGMVSALIGHAYQEYGRKTD